MAKINTNIKGYNLKETGDDVERILQSVDNKADKSELPTIDNSLSTTSDNPIANKAVANAINCISDGTTEISPKLGAGTEFGDQFKYDGGHYTFGGDGGEYDINDGLEFLSDISKYNGSYHLPEITTSNGLNIDNGDMWLTPSKYSGYTSLLGIASDLHTLKTNGISISAAEKAQLIAEIKQTVIADMGANVAHYEDFEEE